MSLRIVFQSSGFAGCEKGMDIDMRKEIIVECSEMEDMAHAYSILEKALGLAKGSVTDMDSLYDSLLELSEPVELTFEDMDLLEVYLGEEGAEILETFERAASENENLELI